MPTAEMNLRTIIFGNQKQSSRQMEVVVEFVKNYLTSHGYGQNLEDSDASDKAIANALFDLIPEIWKMDTKKGTLDWFFLRLFLGNDACTDMWKNPADYDINSVTQANGKIHYYAYVVYDEEDELDMDVPQIVDTTDAEKIVETVINSCPPSERSKLPADDKLAAVLLSQAYWQGKI